MSLMVMIEFEMKHEKQEKISNKPFIVHYTQNPTQIELMQMGFKGAKSFKKLRKNFGEERQL